MPHEIVNTLRSKSTIRVVGTGNTQINLVNFSANTSQETVSAAAITHVTSVTNGIWRIYRGTSTTGGAAPSGGVLVLELPSTINIDLHEHGIVIANNSTSNVFIEHTGTAGTLMIQFAKTATYNPDIVGM